MCLATSDIRTGRRFMIRSALRYALVVVMLYGIGATEAPAQCEQQQKLTASDAAEGDFFGGSVSVSGDTLVVGAFGDDCAAGGRCGSAYVYRFNGTDWIEEQKLTASDIAVYEFFGNSVTVSGDTVVVGAYLHNCAAGSDCGAAYVFRHDGTTWVEEQRLTASDAAAGDFFGGSVSVSADTVVVGAWHDDCAAGDRCGSAYVYHFDGNSWIEEQKLTASDAAAKDWFGVSVSVSADAVVVGAHRDDCATGVNCGSASVYRFNGTTWAEEQKLTASDAGKPDNFGVSVSVSGDTIVVGATRNPCTEGLDCGSAFVFRFDGISWLEVQRLNASDAGGGDHFGYSVSVSGDMAVVGAMWNDCAAGDRCGSAYVYHFDGNSWIEEQKLTASDAAAKDWFGVSVSVSGDTAVAGAQSDDCAAGYGCGSAYVFSCASAPTVVNLDVKPGSCPNPVNTTSRGVVPVAIVGSESFDVSDVDLNSITLSRTDGVGEAITPVIKRNGRLHAAFDDVAAPSGTTDCDCQELDGDGLPDLLLKFSTEDMAEAFELDALESGTPLSLTMRGTFFDGTPFEATDCIVVPGSGRQSPGVRRASESRSKP